MSKQVLIKTIGLLCSTSILMSAIAGCSSSKAGAVSDQTATGSVSGLISRGGGNSGSGPRSDDTTVTSGSGTSATVTTGGVDTVGSASASTTSGSAPTTSSPVSAPATTTSTTSSSAANVSTSTAVKKSIKNWATCNGTTDDSDALSRALNAAKGDAFTLVIDCPLLIKIGQDISKPMFIDSGTTVEFTSAGKLTVDNIFIPAFVMSNARAITLTDWNIEYVGGLPVQPAVNYENKGQLYSGSSPGVAFNEQRITPWLVANRGLTFDHSKGWTAARWSGSTNICAMFYMIGTTQDVNVTGMKVYVPQSAGANQFIPVVYSVNAGWKSRQTISANTPADSRYISIPSDINFENISLDGTLMGWVGIAKNVSVENVTSARYADLQDANGNYVGGVGKWFAPPHLFYWSVQPLPDQALWNSNIQIKNVNDLGVRLGTARDKGGSDPGSGSTPSLKISCNYCIVDTYKSARPDGFVDVLTSNGLTVSNVVATFDTSFTHNLYHPFRWPTQGYKSVTFENVTLTDTAAISIQSPIGPANTPGNEDITMTNVQVNLNKWGSSDSILPAINSTNTNVNVAFTEGANVKRIAFLQKAPESVVVYATPAIIKAGDSTTLNWTGRDVNSCAGSGAFSGPLYTWNASKTVKLTKAGNYDFTVTCRSSDQSVSSTVRVIVQ